MTIVLTSADVEEIVADDLAALRLLISTRPASPGRRRLERVIARMPSRIARAGPYEDREAMTAVAVAELSAAVEALQALR